MKKIALFVLVSALLGGATYAYSATHPRAQSAIDCPSTPECPNVIDPQTGEEICPAAECRCNRAK